MEDYSSFNSLQIRYLKAIKSKRTWKTSLSIALISLGMFVTSCENPKKEVMGKAIKKSEPIEVRTTTIGKVEQKCTKKIHAKSVQFSEPIVTGLINDKPPHLIEDTVLNEKKYTKGEIQMY